MAVSLPPPLTPQLGNVEELRSRSGGAMDVTYQQYRLHVFGADGLVPQPALQSAVAAADSLSNAVRTIGTLYYRAGYPATQLVYAISGDDLYVLVTLGVVTTTAGPDDLTRYFTGMDASRPLTDAMLEPRRTLANLQADRAGRDVTPEFLLQSNGTYQLDLKAGQEGPRQTAFKFEVNNPGNRFVGRHFADIDARLNDRWGDEFHFLARRSLDFLNSHNEGNDYTEFDVAWDRVTPYGVFGLAGSSTHYHLLVEDVNLGSNGLGTVDLPVRGDQLSGEVDWFDVLAAGFSSRWTVQARLGRTDKKLDALAYTETIGESQQHELYNWAELSTVYSHVFTVGEQQLTVEGGVAVGKGLSGAQAGNPTDFAYLFWKPSLKVQLQTTHSFAVTLDSTAQFTRHTLPEQQQWILGGLNNGSAYLPGLAVGDSGLITRLSGETLPVSLGSHLKLLPRVFAEYGHSKLSFEGVHPQDQPESPQGRPAIADVGVELDIAAFDWLETTLTYAQPIYDRDIDDDELDASRAYLYFQVAAKF